PGGTQFRFFRCGHLRRLRIGQNSVHRSFFGPQRLSAQIGSALCLAAFNLPAPRNRLPSFGYGPALGTDFIRFSPPTNATPPNYPTFHRPHQISPKLDQRSSSLSRNHAVEWTPLPG